MTSSSSVTIYGVSDDLIEVKGSVPGCDEYDAECASFLVEGEAGKADVTFSYNHRGLWDVLIMQTEEDVPLLPATMDSTGYSVKLTFSGVTKVRKLDTLSSPLIDRG